MNRGFVACRMLGSYFYIVGFGFGFGSRKKKALCSEKRENLVSPNAYSFAFLTTPILSQIIFQIRTISKL